MNKTKKLLLIALTLQFTISLQAHAGSQAFADGQAAAEDSLSTTHAGVNQSSVDIVTSQRQGSTSQLQATFAASNAGNVGLSQDGTDKVNKCKSLPPTASVEEKEECDAVNELAKNPLKNARNKTGLNKNDPLFKDQNNMFNQGMSQAKNTNTSVGGGTPQNGDDGSGQCVTTETTSPPIYTNETCQRGLAETTQTCAVTSLATVTRTAYCDVNGSGNAVSYIYGGEPYSGTNIQRWKVEYACGDKIGDIFTSVTATLTAVSLGANEYHHTPVVLKFIPGSDAPMVSAAPIRYYREWQECWSSCCGGVWCSGKSETRYYYAGLSYDGKTGEVRVHDLHIPQNYNSCPKDTTFIPSRGTYSVQGPCSAWTYDYWGNSVCSGYSTVTVTPGKGACQTEGVPATAEVPNNPVYHSDTSPIYSYVATYAGDYNGFEYVITDSTACPAGTIMGVNYTLPWGGFPWSPGKCYVLNNGECPATFDAQGWYKEYGPITGGIYQTTYCTLNSARSIRNFAPAATYYGKMGFIYSLNDDKSDTCNALQQKTDSPTNTPATYVNGAYACPTGKRLSGSYCI